MNFWSLLVDLIILLVVGFTIWRSARRGFVRTVLELAGFVLSLVIAFSVSGWLSNIIYENSVRPTVEESVSEVLADAKGGSTSQAVDQVWEALPSVVRSAANSFGITKGDVQRKLNGAVESGSSGVESVAVQVADSMARPVVTGLLKTIIFLVVFLLLAIVVKFLARVINRAFSFPVVGTINRLLGGVLGIPKGIIYGIVLCSVFKLLIDYTGGLGPINGAVLDHALLFGLLCALNPFI